MSLACLVIQGLSSWASEVCVTFAPEYKTKHDSRIALPSFRIGNRMLDEDYVAGAHLPGSPPEPISHMDLAGCLEDPQRSRALLCWNINIAASNPQQARLRQALTRADLFTVAIDLFATDTTDLADVVLPAASFLESDDLVASYFHLSLSAQVKATEPLGQSLPNTEIFRRLATAIGFGDDALHEPDEQIIAEVLRRAGLGIDFASLARQGTIWIYREPRVQFAGRRCTHIAHGPDRSRCSPLGSGGAAGNGRADGCRGRRDQQHPVERRTVGHECRPIT
jgi:anaerobic selenocysteine-containing dehydrogenase